MDRKGQAGFGQLVSFAIGIASVVIVIIVTYLVIASGKAEIGNAEGANCDISNSSACNATKDIETSVGQIPAFMPIIILAGIGVVILGIVTLFSKGRN